MAKNYNPADAFRKAQRAKEVKKNKEVRKKVRETQTVKRDTRDLEAEIRSLNGKKDNASKSRIAELESELSYVQKTKEAYVKEHPDEKDKVFKPRVHTGIRQSGEEEEEADENGASGSKRGRLYDETGRLRDPTRSAYYDPVYNPWGVPPPGLPYKEKPGLKDTEDSDEEGDEEEESDEEIIMPEGPPPDGSDEDEDSDDDDEDIPLPSGPPPAKAAPQIPPMGPSGWGGRQAPIPIPFHQPPPIHMNGMGMGMPPPIPYQQQPPIHMNGGIPPPIPFPQHQPHAGPSRHFRPPRVQTIVQDPLDDTPTQTYQSYHASLPNPENPIPGLPGSLPPPAPTPVQKAAPTEITAAPQLRDLRKEATVFVPRNLKRKAPTAGGRINAAPGAGVVDDEGDEVLVRKMDSGLMGKLKGVLGPDVGSGGGKAGGQGRSGGGGKTAMKGADEDYEKFLAGLGDIS